MEFQAVVMAAGMGTRMTDITELTPKALLPICNKPMIWYSINLLYKSGFTEVIIILLKSTYNEIVKILKEFQHRIRFEYIQLADDHNFGTVDSLKIIKEKITTDLLVISCDLITNFPLHLLADDHRTNDASLTMLIAEVPNITSEKVNSHIENDIIGLNTANNKVLYYSSKLDLDNYISFKVADLYQYPNINIFTQVFDAHIYLMKKEVLDIIEYCSQYLQMTMLKGEVVPYLVKQQFYSENLNNKDNSVLYEFSQLEDYSKKNTNVVKELSSWPNEEINNISCYAYMLNNNTLCIRANTLTTYHEINKN